MFFERGYSAVSLNKPLVGVYVWESTNVPPEALRRTHAAVRETTKCWADALTAEQPRIDERVARLRAGAALSVLEELVRLGHFYQRRRIRQELRTVAFVILRQPA